jgi:flagella basal body P-ring formation protein FlgA
VDAYTPVPVAAAEIQRGQILQPLDIKTENRLLSSMPKGVTPVPRDVSQFTARRAIRAGETITEEDLEPRILVRRRQLVSVTARAGGLDIQTQARAETDAAEGDIITCTNISSKEAFQGIVLGNGTVYIP